MRKPKSGKLVEIIWIDAKAYSNEWIDLEQVKSFKPENCVTAGYIVHEDTSTYFVAQTKGEGIFHNIFLIPKGCVKEIR